MDPDERERLRQADTSSRSEHRAETRTSLTRRETLAKALAELDPRKRAKLELDPKLIEEIELFARLSKGSALARQRRHLVRTLGEFDFEEISRQLAVLVGDVKHDARHHRLERILGQLLEQGDDALDAYLAEHPEADRQRLRQAVRAAQKEQADGAPAKGGKTRRRELYLLLRG